MKITLYSVPWCKPCGWIKAYLQERGIVYEEVTVADEWEQREVVFQVSGQYGVPVVTIDEHVIIGFQEEEMNKYIFQK